MKEELFPLLKEHMLEVVLPNHKEILRGCLGENKGTCKDAKDIERHESEAKAMIQQIVKKASENPEKVCSTFLTF